MFMRSAYSLACGTPSLTSSSSFCLDDCNLDALVNQKVVNFLGVAFGMADSPRRDFVSGLLRINGAVRRHFPQGFFQLGVNLLSSGIGLVHNLGFPLESFLQDGFFEFVAVGDNLLVVCFEAFNVLGEFV